MSAALHPIFGGIVADFVSGLDEVRKAQVDTYRALLQRHDWSFEYSDDHSVWQRGTEQLRELRMLQAELDVDGSIWNSVAPAYYRLQVAQ